MRIAIARGDLKREISGSARRARLAGLASDPGRLALRRPLINARWWRLAGVPTPAIALIASCVGWLLLGYVIGRRTEFVRTWASAAALD